MFDAPQNESRNACSNTDFIEHSNDCLGKSHKDYHNFFLDGEPHQKTKVETAFEIAGEVCLALAIGSFLILAIHHGADVVAQFSPNAY